MSRPVEFRIADTFTDSLARLTGEEQKLVKTTAFDLQLDPSRPGMQFHRIDGSKDRRFWSIRVNQDIRLIVHRSESSLLLCYVDHHDRAYAWAERRKLETHPTTGAAQLVELVETVREVPVPRYVEAPTSPPRSLFDAIDDEEFLSHGVPPQWLGRVRAATEDTILDIASHLPAEAAEAILDLATGRKLAVIRWAGPGADPFEHPDARRRFRTVSDADELAAALEYPWDKWTVFLHPAQRDWVERPQTGPSRVAGTAGTGKTIVALHRAVFLVRMNPDARVLLTTFSDALANALDAKLRRLLIGQPRLGERIDVASLDAIALRLHKFNLGKPKLATSETIRELIAEAAEESEGLRVTAGFVLSEFTDVVDAWQLDSWETYRDVARLGRKTRLPEAQRVALWSVFERVRSGLRERGLITIAELLGRLTQHYARTRSPYDHVVIDEAQDISVAQLRFVASLAGDRPDGLFFAGDLGQRIFRQPFSWKSLGVNVTGRSRTLRVNYRTSHQIRIQADRLLAPEVSDVDGYTEERRGAVSVFNGPDPAIATYETEQAEAEAVGRWLLERQAEGVTPEEIAVFVRSPAEFSRAREAVANAALRPNLLDARVVTRPGEVSIGTMHLAKGLEFRTVVVMACDDEVIPLAERIEGVTDDADLEDVYNTERHLLYVSCTRARDHLLVTAVEPASEFLEDLGAAD